MKFNKKQVHYRVNEVNDVGNVESAQRLKPDPEKEKAVDEYPKPENEQDLQQFFGMATYLGQLGGVMLRASAPSLGGRWFKLPAESYQRL